MFRGIYHGRQKHPGITFVNMTTGDLTSVLNRAFKESGGLKRIIITAGSLSEAREAVSLCSTDGIQGHNDRLDRLYCTLGYHPTRTMEWHLMRFPDQEAPRENETTSCMRSILSSMDHHMTEMIDFYHNNKASGRIVAIGEFGLGLGCP